jgi:hypothetical protein
LRCKGAVRDSEGRSKVKFAVLANDTDEADTLADQRRDRSLIKAAGENWGQLKLKPGLRSFLAC